MQQKTKKECLKRINYIKGHLEGIKKMLQEDRYCIDIIQQNLGVISALLKINEIILNSHLETCVSNAVKSGDISHKRKIFKELIKIYHLDRNK